MKHFLIQHPSRGWYLKREYVLGEWVPKFAWSISARDKRVKVMFSIKEAQQEMSHFKANVAAKCTITVLKRR